MKPFQALTPREQAARYGRCCECRAILPCWVRVDRGRIMTRCEKCGQEQARPSARPGEAGRR